MTDLLEFSKTVPFSKIPDYILQKTDEKGKLEAKINELNDRKWKLIGDISNLETRHLVALDDQKITEDNLKWYSDLKEELEKNGLSVDDISHLAKVVNGIRQYGFNTEQVLNEFSNLELLKAQCQGYQCSIARLKNQYDTLNRDFSFLQQRVSSYNQSLSKYNELEAMGFGLKGLKLLWHTIREIAVANDIPLDDAIQKFLKDIDLQYDDKLGFESKVDKLQVEVNRLNQEYNRLCAELSVFPCIGPTLLGLLQAGVKEKDIMNLTELLKTDSTITTAEERQLLIDEIRKYGGIKSTIKKLTQQVGELRDEVASLEAQKQDPNTYNQKMCSTLVYSKQSLDVVVSEGTVPKEFVPLIRAARGFPVGLPEFKASVMEALKEIIVARQNQQIK